jgi:hypothetical protein
MEVNSVCTFRMEQSEASVVPTPSGSLGEPTMAVLRPILEFLRGPGANGSRKSEAS